MSWAAFAQNVKVVDYYDQEGAQTKIKNVYYVKKEAPSVLHGGFLQFYESGVLSIKGNYEDNIPKGVWEYFYESGSLKNRARLQNTSDGYWWYYFEEGGVSKEGRLSKNKEEGSWKFYYQNGKIRKSGDFKEGLKQGEWTYFFEDSVKKATAIFENGQGVYKEYFYNGILKMEGPLVGDQPEGIWTYYYPDGAVKAQGLELDGKKNGLWKFYYQNGILLKTGRYSAGKAFGEWQYFYEDGALNSKGVVKDGKRNDLWQFYNDTGEELTVDYTNDIGVYQEFYSNGQVKIKGQLEGSKREGKWMYYYPDGGLKAECDYENNIGEYVGYFKNGKISTRGQLEGVKKKGIWELHNKSGDVVYLRTIYNGVSKADTSNSSVSANVDSLVFQSVNKTKEETYSNKVFKYKPIQKWRLGKRWLTKKPNEAHGVILNVYPFNFFKDRFQFSIETFIQERQGFEFGLTYINNDFLYNADSKEKLELFSPYLKMKVYSRNSRYGMWSMGPGARYTLDLRKTHVNEVALFWSLGKEYVQSFKQGSLAIQTGVDVGVGYRYLQPKINFPFNVYFGVGWFFEGKRRR